MKPHSSLIQRRSALQGSPISTGRAEKQTGRAEARGKNLSYRVIHYLHAYTQYMFMSGKSLNPETSQELRKTLKTLVVRQPCIFQFIQWVEFCQLLSTLFVIRCLHLNMENTALGFPKASTMQSLSKSLFEINHQGFF